MLKILYKNCPRYFITKFYNRISGIPLRGWKTKYDWLVQSSVFITIQ